MKGEGRPEPRASREIAASPFAFFLSASTLIILLGLSISLILFSHLSAIATGSWKTAASAACQGKAWVIANWNKERQGDAFEIRASLRSLKEFLDQGSPLARRERARRVLSAMREIRSGFNLTAVALLDEQGRALLVEPSGGIPVSARLEPLVAEALRRRSVVTQDGVLEPDGSYLSQYFLPLNDEPGPAGRDVVLGMWVEVSDYLKGILWPPENSSFGFEQLLVMADGRELHLVARPGDPGRGALLELGTPHIRAASLAPASSPGRGLVRARFSQPPEFFEVAAQAVGAPWSVKVRLRPNTILAPLWLHCLYRGFTAAALLVSVGCAVLGFWTQRATALKLRLAQSELEHSRSRRQYESLVQQVCDIVLWADAQGHILDANERALVLYGYSLDELRRMRVPELRPPEHRQESEKTIREIREKGLLTFPAIHQKKNGQQFPVEVTARLVRFQDEELILGTVRDVTALEEAETSLRQSEDRLKTALRHASVILARQDPDLRYEWCYGKHPQDCPGGVAGRCDEDLFGPLEAERLKEIKVAVLATGKGARTEVRRRGRSGDVCLDLIVEPERDPSGRVTGLINVMVDVTERKLAQALLESSEQKYRRLVEQIPGAVYARALSPEFAWIYISPRVRELLGFTPLEWTGTPGLPERQVHPEDLNLIRSALCACVKQRQSVSLEYRIFHRDGRLLWFRDRISLAEDENGSPSHVQGLLIDITEMRVAQGQIQRLSVAIEQSPVSVVIADAAGLIEYANAEFCRRIGRDRDETLGRPLLELRPEYAHLTGSGNLPQQVLAGAVLQGEVAGKRRNGGAYWERVVIAGSRGTGRSAQHLVVISQDITEIREYAEQVRQLQKMDAVGRLAGGIAHDFNNILTVLRGYSDLLLDEMRQDDPSRPAVEEIHKAAERGSELVRQLLAFSRKQPAHPSTLNLNHVVQSASSMLSRLLGEHIRIEAKLDPDLRVVSADPGQLEQVLMNLAVNSRDAMPSGGTLRISTRNCTVSPASSRTPLQPLMRPGEYVELSVEDDGCGIPPEVLPHIFEPFFTTKSAGKGTGLGLSTVYGIVQQNGGYIRAESPNGQGAVFRIWLPAEGCPPGGGTAEQVGQAVSSGS